MTHLRQCTCNGFAARVPLNAPFLVADTPENDAGMATVMANHGSQYMQLRSGNSCQTVLIDHHDTQRIAHVEHYIGSGMMRRAIGIHAHGLQLSQAPQMKSVGNSHSHSGMVLVHIYALYLQGFAIEHKPAVGIEHHMADAVTVTCGIT